MKPDTVAQIIKWYGDNSKNWLKNIEPATLFSFLEGKYRGTAEVIKEALLNDNEGWMLFIDEVGPEEKSVIGYFYQKGELPRDYSGQLKYKEGGVWDWKLVLEILPSENPKIIAEIDRFREKVFKLVLRKEVVLSHD